MAGEREKGGRFSDVGRSEGVGVQSPLRDSAPGNAQKESL
jgi:hypothetical protein